MQSFGPFMLLEPLARGGMGEVWLAAPQLPDLGDDLCVLKRVKSELADQDAAVRRFVDEARLGMLLRHPCLSRTIDAGRADGSDYLAAELVEGIDLAMLLGRTTRGGRAIDPAIALWCMAGALDGLAWAHAAKHPITGEPLGVVHRDISPQNLMATRDGVVRVIDFGLALSSVKEASTQMGIVMGKLGYMAPEQARGEVVNDRCDVFSAGVVLYELVRQERYQGQIERVDLRTRVATGLYRPPGADDVDDATDGLFSAMTAPQPGDRPSAAEARDVLLARLTRLGGVDDASRRLAGLIRDVAAPELARVDEARARARQLITHAAPLPPTTMSLAISESRAVLALLQTQPPAMTREVSADKLVPGQMWRPSPSLLAIAAARAAADLRTEPEAPPPTPPAPPAVPIASPPPSGSPPRRAPPRVALAVTGVLGLAGALGALWTTTGAPTATSTTAAPTLAPESTGSTGLATPPSPTTPTPPPPAPVTTPPPATTTAAPPEPTSPRPAGPDPLPARVRALHGCTHSCARTFDRVTREGLSTLSGTQRRALEQMVGNCEKVCR